MDNVLDTIKHINTPRMDRVVERFRENAPQFVEAIRNNLRVGPVEGDFERQVHNDFSADGADLHDDEIAMALAAAVAAKVRMENENRASRPIRRMVRNLKSQCPEDWRGAVEKILHREQDLNYEDCDANGRPVASGRYNDSLNEHEEAREQPPPHSSTPSRIAAALSPRNHPVARERVQQVMSALRSSHTPQEAFQKARSAVTCNLQSSGTPEYYTNFNDEGGVGERTTTAASMGRYSAPQHSTPTKDKNAKESEYAEIDDGTSSWKQSGGISHGHKKEVQQKQQRIVETTPTKNHPKHSLSNENPLHSTAQYHWGAPKEEQESHGSTAGMVEGEEEEEGSTLEQTCRSTEEDSSTTTGSTCSETEHPVEEEEPSQSSEYPQPHLRLHSTAKYQWGAVSSSSPIAKVQ